MVQFCNAWTGFWKFEALNDIMAWKKSHDFIKTHTSVVKVGIVAIYELDVQGKKIRKLPDQEECKKHKITNIKSNEKQVEQAMYIAYFSDGLCSGPFIADVINDDKKALELAQLKLEQHAEYNKINKNELKLIQVVEINENKIFTINLERKKHKKNRNLL
jgi:hypothetical protein